MDNEEVIMSTLAVEESTADQVIEAIKFFKDKYKNPVIKIKSHHNGEGLYGVLVIEEAE